MKIIGIDPAPSKKSTIFNGVKFSMKSSFELDEYVCSLKNDSKVLICWDAPLSFFPKGSSKQSIFYKRKIEYFFSRVKGMKTPSGISVLGYAGCPHWAITQYVLGYPRIRRINSDISYPFHLTFSKRDISNSVTEVHPAVAIWLWTCEENKAGWEYKKNKDSFYSILNILVAKRLIPSEIAEEIKTDDELDAYIAWKLGDLWVNETNVVEILGDNETGSFLLPYCESLFEKFKNFEVK